jgi:hypothetical protein
MAVTLRHHALGISWIDDGPLVRTAHALLDEGRVWLIDPYEDEPALDAAASLGAPAGVIQLLDRHNRDCEALAERLSVPLLRLPSHVPDAPFEVIPVISRWRWREIALWWEERRALIVAEAIGTATAFTLGRRAGVHPLLRLTPPRSQLARFRPTMLLVGHGAPIETGGAAALAEALDRSRGDLPRLVTAVPKLLRGGSGSQAAQ